MTSRRKPWERHLPTKFFSSWASMVDDQGNEAGPRQPVTWTDDGRSWKAEAFDVPYTPGLYPHLAFWSAENGGELIQSTEITVQRNWFNPEPDTIRVEAKYTLS